MAWNQISPQRLWSWYARTRSSARASLFGAALAMIGGCSGGPARVAAPDWDPAGIAESIVADLDKNSDGAVDAEELKEAPGLAAGARFVDADNDGKLTAEEIETRFDKYVALKIGLRGKTFRITYKGRPVANAEVRFIPEDFLMGTIEPATGTTDDNGVVSPIAEGKDRGMRVGYYRVQIVSGGATIPDAYRTEASPLGADVSLSEDAASYNSLPELKIAD